MKTKKILKEALQREAIRAVLLSASLQRKKLCLRRMQELNNVIAALFRFLKK